MIIDAHAHLGVDRVFDEIRTEEELLRTMEENQIDATIVQNMVGTIDMESIRSDHDRIFRLTKKYPKRFFGLISMNPHIKKEEYMSEYARCVEDLGFVGVKLHALAHACNPMSEDGRMVWECAARHKTPLMVHTGSGIPFAMPAQVIPRAKEFPDTKVVLAHSGMIFATGEAMIAAQECTNIYLETSWCAVHHIAHFVAHYGANRVLFAGDEASNVPVELEKYRLLNLTKEQRAYCLSKTAIQVFNLNV